MRLRSAGFWVLLLFTLLAMPAHAQERFGGIAGVVTDTSQAPVPGATVTITNKQNGAVRTVVTANDGSYRVPDLDPGRYTVSIELQGFQKSTADDVQVLLGRTFTINAQLQVGARTEQVTVTGQAERPIDLTTVTLQHNVTAEEFNELPKGRTFQSMAMASPGVSGLADINNNQQNNIEGGLQINGASAAENTYTVDGVVTNSPIEGQSRQNTVFEYLQEVQVKTSGIDAQYGGALGGVISAVTKSGGNIFTGEAHEYFFGNPLSSAPVKRLVLNPVTQASASYVQDAKQKYDQNEFGGSLGGPIVKDQLFFFASISPRLVNRTNNYAFSDAPGSIDQTQKLWQGFGKVTLNSGRVHANVSLLMTPTRSTGFLPAYNNVSPNAITTTLASNAPNIPRGFNDNQDTISGNIDYWMGKESYLSLRGGYFYDSYKDTGVSQTTSYTYRTSSLGIAGVPANLQGATGFANTPRVEIDNFDTTKQPYVQMDYNQTFNAAGSHLLKAGVGYRHTTNDVNNAYPGGYVYIYWGQTYTSGFNNKQDTGQFGYYQVNDFGTQGKVGANIWSLYAQDAWSIGQRLVLNLGLRTENEKVPTFQPQIAPYAFQFGFGDKLAPRLGVAYDVAGNGRSKLSASWGRYYDWTKYELARGSFGGDIWHQYTRSLDSPLDLSNVNLSNMPGRDLFGGPLGYQDLRGTSIQNTDPAIKPMYEDSFNAGWDYQLSARTGIGVHFVRSSLGRTIEDMGSTVNGSDIYVIGNPGEGENLITSATYPATADFATPKAHRVYDALELSFEKRMSDNWFFSANYTLSRLFGNYSGLSNTDEVLTPTTGVSSGTSQQQTGSTVRPGSNASAAWDVDQILWDSHGNLDVEGLLPTDRPHAFKLYGAYTFPFGTQVGLFQYAASGTPISTYVIAQPYGYFPLVNGRGDMGRTPVLSRTDLLISHNIKLNGKQSVRLELNVLNLFNQETATHIFNFLNKGAPGESSFLSNDAINLSKVNLAKGYDYNALILASPGGASAYDPRYGMGDLFQPGRQGQVSIRYSF